MVRPPALVAALVMLAAASSSDAPLRRPAMDRLPRVFVWAWERPEDLRGLAPGIGVAFLAQTISITRHGVHVAPRRQPLRVAPASALLAVTRIEIVGSATPSPVDDVVSSIAATADLPRVAGVQVDFDATTSERPLYRDLLRRLRARLPATMPISVTALASWCDGDDWLSGLPVDEAVPMLFRMGPSNAPFLRMATSPASAAPVSRKLGAAGRTDRRADQRSAPHLQSAAWTEATLFQARRLVTE
jgi:hypothetical protein